MIYPPKFRQLVEKIVKVIAWIIIVYVFAIVMSSCTPEFEMPAVRTLTPVDSEVIITPTLSAEAQRFRGAVDQYERRIRSCAGIETGEYLGGDVAMLFLQQLQEDQTLFKNPHFVKVWNWLMDDILTYCTNLAVDDPITALRVVNDLFMKADQEYYQYQRQGRYGIEEGNMDLIESAFEHREKAHGFMQEAAYYYDDLFDYY